MTDLRNPVKAEVRFVPATGSLRPYEVWLTSGNGRVYQRGSFATEKAAQKKVDAVKEMFNIK